MNSVLRYIEPLDRSVAEHVSKRLLRDGEERLMLAVLESAIEDYQKYVLAQDKRGKELFEEAEEWIMETGSSSFFSFENICAHLQLAPDYVRRGFQRWKAARIEALARSRNTDPRSRRDPMAAESGSQSARLAHG